MSTASPAPSRVAGGGLRRAQPVSSRGEDHGSGRRPALDGMRAVAVTSVAVYHFGGGATSWLPGGFLGVDVFFVLSGYLITSLLLTEYARRGRIDLPGFWVRRVRRLAPALVAMLLVVCGWIWWATPMESYPTRRGDVLWTVGYLANWHLISRSDDYFASYAAASPLRHAWSLSVEEQFYLFWPLVVALLLALGYRLARGRGKRYRLLPVGVAAVAGIVLSFWAMSSAYDPLYPSAAYYGTQGRVQELFVGVLLAVVVTRWRAAGLGGIPEPFRRIPGLLTRRAALVAGAGLAVLGVAFLTMSDAEPFYYRGGALAVSLAVAVLIAVLDLAPQGRVARAFSWRPAVALGRISYGVYLWHWPITLMIPITPGMSTGLAARHQVERVVLTLAVSALSFRFLEQPVQRDRRWLSSRPRVLVAVLASSALVVSVAWPATALPGTLADQLSVTSDRSCPGGERVDLLLTCTAPVGADAGEDPPDLALLGDSTARALGPGLDTWAREEGTTWVEAAWKRCSATGLMVVPAGLTEPDVAGSTCSSQAPGLIRNVLSTYRPKVVLIAEFWPSGQPLLVGGELIQPGTPRHDAVLRAAYENLVDEIAEFGGRAVFVELPPPGDSIGDQFAAARPASGARPAVSGGGRFVAGYNSLLRSVAADRPGLVSTVSVTDVLCPGGECPAVVGDTLLRTDGLHYSLKFSNQVARVVLARAGVAG